MPNDPSSLNLTGAWNGLYSYPRLLEPVPFMATLIETSSWLVGTIEETGTYGDAFGVKIGATLQGRRAGRSVTFLKTYNGSYRAYKAVDYAGSINEDTTEIEGRWTIPGVWSGTFLMIRADSETLELVREDTIGHV